MVLRSLVISKKSGRLVQILWPSHNMLTLWSMYAKPFDTQVKIPFLNSFGYTYLEKQETLFKKNQ